MAKHIEGIKLEHGKRRAGVKLVKARASCSCCGCCGKGEAADTGVSMDGYPICMRK
jgi:hypothetical protein